MMWSLLPLKGMMVTICGGCEANNILVLFTRFMPPSLNTQVALVNGWMGIARQLSQPHFGQVWGWSPTLGKVGGLESAGTPECSELDNKAQNTSHWGVFGVIGKVLKRDIENGLALAIPTSAAQVMGKRRAGSQTGNLTPDH
jgi:hypothetical protein